MVLQQAKFQWTTLERGSVQRTDHLGRMLAFDLDNAAPRTQFNRANRLRGYSGGSGDQIQHVAGSEAVVAADAQ